MHSGVNHTALSWANSRLALAISNRIDCDFDAQFAL